MGALSNFWNGIKLNEQEKVDVAQGKALWDQRQEAKRKMNNETDPNKRAELQKDFETKDKAYSEYNSPEQRKLRAAQARGNEPESEPEPGKESKADDKQKQEGDKMNKTTDNTTGRPSTLSASFYRDFAAGLRNKPKGNTLDVQAATEKSQAQNYQNRKADRQMEAQASQQIANRNEYTEAGKIASMQNNAQNMQNINNLSAAAGNSAALQRKITTPDVQSQQSRQDQQRSVANAQREKANTAQEESTGAAGYANELDIRSRDYDQDLDKAHKLSMGEGTGSEETTQNATQSEPQPELANKPEDNKPAEQPYGDSQHVINALLGSSAGADLRNGTAKSDTELYNWALSQGVQPIQPKSTDSNQWESEFIANGPAYANVIDKLRWARSGGTDKTKNYTGKDDPELNREARGLDTGGISVKGQDDLPSDNRIKDIHDSDLCDILSDLKMKFIKEDWDQDGQPSEEDFMWLLKRAGKFKNGDMEYDALEDNSDITDQEVLSGYADFIKNYVYNYKPESGENPDVTHIGPMAQDIEQVNPACIKEDENGIKSVDTRRLAMMNAGAIGELARQLQDISDRLSKAGI